MMGTAAIPADQSNNTRANLFNNPNTMLTERLIQMACFNHNALHLKKLCFRPCSGQQVKRSIQVKNLELNKLCFPHVREFTVSTLGKRLEHDSNNVVR